MLFFANFGSIAYIMGEIVECRLYYNIYRKEDTKGYALFIIFSSFGQAIVDSQGFDRAKSS